MKSSIAQYEYSAKPQQIVSLFRAHRKMVGRKVAVAGYSPARYT